MDKLIIETALVDIRAEKDPSVKSQKLASLCSTLFRERGIELVVVGGSAVEFYTEGAYTSGDLDLCILSPSVPLSVRTRQQIMGQLDARGGPRSWEVAGMFVDVLGPAEISSAAPLRKLDAPYGIVTVIDAEELIVERILVAFYPSTNSEALACAKQLLAVALEGKITVDWEEIRRLAQSPDFDILPQLKQVAKQLSHELKLSTFPDPLR